MIVLHIVGGVLTLVGAGLFVWDQVRGAKEGESTLGVWKVNLSGPPSLVLILIGVLMFVFPFTSFWKDPTAAAPPPVTTTTQPVTTTTGQIDMPTTTTTTTIDCTRTFDVLCGDAPEFDVFAPEFDSAVLPETPVGFDIYLDDTCGGEDVIEWYQTEAGYVDVYGWQIQIEKYELNGSLVDTQIFDTEIDQFILTYGNYEALCYWDFVDPDWNAVFTREDGYYYWIWIYSYNDAGFSLDPLFIEYFDVVQRGQGRS